MASLSAAGMGLLMAIVLSLWRCIKRRARPSPTPSPERGSPQVASEHSGVAPALPRTVLPPDDTFPPRHAGHFRSGSTCSIFSTVNGSTAGDSDFYSAASQVIPFLLLIYCWLNIHWYFPLWGSAILLTVQSILFSRLFIFMSIDILLQGERRSCAGGAGRMNGNRLKTVTEVECAEASRELLSHPVISALLQSRLELPPPPPEVLDAGVPPLTVESEGNYYLPLIFHHFSLPHATS